VTCDDYLAMLETLPVEDLVHGEARDHAAECRDCNRVTRVVMERERSMIMAYGDVYPSAPAATVAATAVLAARRRRVAFFSRMALGIAAAVAVAVVAVSRVAGPPPHSLVTARLSLHCLSQDQALELILPYIDESNSVSFFERPSTVRIMAPGPKVQAVRAALDQAGQSMCPALMAPPQAPKAVGPH
jgi:hypothetical protein